ncbi:MAG TPA: transcriptional regulator [Roseiarcus sp.]|nr:transcriptional regulator [Roseiarcus sp.]
MITGEQVKAARNLLGWSTIDLASRSGVGRNAIASFEDQGSRPDEPFVEQIKGALERAGIEFSDREVTLKQGRATWDPPPEP